MLYVTATATATTTAAVSKLFLNCLILHLPFESTSTLLFDSTSYCSLSICFLARRYISWDDHLVLLSSSIAVSPRRRRRRRRPS